MRNTGSTTVIVSGGYLVYPSGSSSALSLAFYTSGTEPWGGDVWTVDPASGAVVLKSSGVVLYDEFNGGLGGWFIVHNSYARRYSVYTSGGNLKVFVKSKYTGKWAVAGAKRRSRLSVSQPYVVEVELFKNGYAYWAYAVSLYLTATDASSNPYYNTPWLAFKLYPRSGATYAQVVYRSASGGLSYVDIARWTGHTKPSGRFVAVVDRGRVEYWFVRGGTVYSGVRYYSAPSQPYLYLVVENPTTYYDEGRFGFIKVYRNTSIKIEGLMPGWTVEVTDENWNPLYRAVANSSYVYVDLLQYAVNVGMPLRGHIKVLAYNESMGGLAIPPGKVRAVAFRLPQGLSPGTYLIKVVSKSGAEAYATLRV